MTVNQFTGKHSITVGGQPATGTRRGQYTLPGADGGTVPAKLRASFLDPYPSIEIAGVKHRSGPAVPIGLRILALFPLVLILGGLLGGGIAAASILANFAVLRTSLPTAGKAAILAAIGIVAVVGVLIILGAIGGATGKA